MRRRSDAFCRSGWEMREKPGRPWHERGVRRSRAGIGRCSRGRCSSQERSVARWGRRGDRTGTDQAPIVYFFKETTAYTYDYRNRLTEVTQGGTVIATYTYDPLDRRIGIDDSGTQTWTVYDGHGADDHPYADFNGSGTLLNRYIWGPGVGVAPSQILARISSGGTFSWYLNDRLGTVRDITGSSGPVIDHVVYDSFGNVTSETNAANGDRFKYAGQEYDATTGQYYDRARYYDEAIGRFMGQDPMGFD